jgi:8-oxo-dGTP diphosphatase
VKSDWNSGDLILKDRDEIRWVFVHELDQFEFAPADMAFVEKLKNRAIKI